MASDRMYDLAFQFKTCKLWQKLADTEMYGVQLTDGEIGYCSVMGMLGEHYALGLYPGQSGFASYCFTLSNTMMIGTPDEVEMFSGQDCLQCSYENRDMLTDGEVEEVRGYCRRREKTPRGRNAFPQFMKYVPGYYPWHLNSALDEERICEALEASIWLSGTLKTHRKEELGLTELQPDTKKIPLLSRNGNRWGISFIDLPSRERIWPTPHLENEVLTARVKNMKKKAVWECGCFYLPAPVQDEEEDDQTIPYFPLILLNVDRKTGMVLHPVMGKADVPEDLVRQQAEGIVEGNICPREIRAGDDRAYALLEDFCRMTGIRLLRDDSLPAFDEAKESLLRQMDRDGEWGDEEDDLAEDELDEEDQLDLDQFVDTLMKMRDEELKTMPRDMVKMLYEMAEWGAVPEALVKRLKKLFR